MARDERAEERLERAENIEMASLLSRLPGRRDNYDSFDDCSIPSVTVEMQEISQSYYTIQKGQNRHSIYIYMYIRKRRSGSRRRRNSRGYFFFFFFPTLLAALQSADEAETFWRQTFSFRCRPIPSHQTCHPNSFLRLDNYAAAAVVHSPMWH